MKLRNLDQSGNNFVDMKRNYIWVLIVIPLFFVSCIGDDFIDDRVEERLSFDNPISELQVNTSVQLEITFFNNVGQPQSADVNWTSSNPLIAEINSIGLLTGISEGDVSIRARVTLENGNQISEILMVNIIPEPVTIPDPITKHGVIRTTSSYVLTGDFTISEILDSENLDLQIDENYAASTSLPGLYLYLTNNPNSIAGALEIGPVEVFSGAHSYEISSTGINEYKYLLYWCKPFSVKVGEGEILD